MNGVDTIAVATRDGGGLPPPQVATTTVAANPHAHITAPHLPQELMLIMAGYVGTPRGCRQPAKLCGCSETAVQNPAAFLIHIRPASDTQWQFPACQKTAESLVFLPIRVSGDITRIASHICTILAGEAALTTLSVSWQEYRGRAVAPFRLAKPSAMAPSGASQRDRYLYHLLTA